MTNQPQWKFLTNLGDVNPLDYGGYFIFVDETGVYAPEGEVYDPDDHKAWRFSLDQCHLYEGRLILKSLFDQAATLPRPLSDYGEWFGTSYILCSVAGAIGRTVEELQRLFCSDDILERADAYHELGMVFGFENLDTDPLDLPEEEAQERYQGL